MTPHAKEYRIPWINACFGQVGTSMVLLCRARFDTVLRSFEGLLHHLQCSGAGLGDPFGGALMGYDTPTAVDTLFLR